uniref:Uncharacterized protein n=1 Tax=Anguilla anguilla TaxID=7936 RepID=A0A0E9TAR0_ANGAN
MSQLSITDPVPRLIVFFPILFISKMKTVHSTP